MKRILFLAVPLIIVLTLVLACTSPAPAPAPAPAPTPAPTPAPKPAPAPTGEKIRWQFQSIEPAAGTIGGNSKWFAEEVTKRTNGQLTIDFFPSFSLNVPGPGILGALKDKVIDGADTIAAYSSGQIPLGYLLDLPGMMPPNRFEDIAATKRVLAAFLPFAQKVYGDAGVVPIVAFSAESRQVFSKKPITKLDDFKGLKMRSAGGFDDAVVKAFGGVPVAAPPPEQYPGLERGILDAVITAWEPYRLFKLYELAKYALMTNYGSTTFYYFISKKAWDPLPANLKDVVTKTGEETVDRILRANYTKFSTDAMWLMQWQGSTVLQPTPEMKKVIADTGDDWLKNKWLKDTGATGQELLTAVQKALAAK